MICFLCLSCNPLPIMICCIVIKSWRLTILKNFEDHLERRLIALTKKRSLNSHQWAKIHHENIQSHLFYLSSGNVIQHEKWLSTKNDYVPMEESKKRRWLLEHTHSGCSIHKCSNHADSAPNEWMVMNTLGLSSCIRSSTCWHGCASQSTSCTSCGRQRRWRHVWQAFLEIVKELLW